MRLIAFYRNGILEVDDARDFKESRAWFPNDSWKVVDHTYVNSKKEKINWIKKIQKNYPKNDVI